MPGILKVALDLPLRTLFDYRCDQPVEIGCRVEVPFGRGKKIGLVAALADQSEIPDSKLKSPLRIIDTTPLISAELAKLLDWASRYYLHPIGEVWFSALPTRLRQGKEPTPIAQQRWRLSEAGLNNPPAARAMRQLSVWQRLKQGHQDDQQLNAELDNWRPAMRQLIEKQLVETEHHFDDLCGSGDEPALTLNPEQQTAVEKVTDSLGQFQPFLLDGVTGSGKTEVYLQIIQQVIDRDQQALLLVPEIGLTAQTIDRFRRRFSCPIALLHSGLSDLQRHNSWLLAASGEAKIIIGTRSALLTPLKNPAIIIIDEEHDGSYKQQEGFRYNARDLAMVRARNLNIPILLGSATPVLESMHAANSGRYQYLQLPLRAGNKAMPALNIIDARHQRMRGSLCSAMLAQVREQINNGQQVLLFLNRRGYAPLQLCDDCGAIPECQRCDSPYTFHLGRQRLVCHHCGSERRPPSQCESCGGDTMVPIGSGTERVEEELRGHFPDNSVLRIDRDSTRKKGELDRHLQQVHSGEAQILLGTQMLAKGHHFPNVTLVGILDCDQALFATDFRASEQLAQLIYQVAGRCGRGEQPGEVLIQTHQPHHPLWQQLLTKTYAELTEELLKERQLTEFPPFQHLALLRAEAAGADRAMELLNQLKQQLPAEDQLNSWGPIRAPKPKKAGFHRAQLLFQANQRPHLHQLLQQAIHWLSHSTKQHQVRWSIDVDPVDLY